MALTDLELGITALMAVATVVVARRYPAAAFALVVAGLLLASSSIPEVKDVFLTARWGGLVALPLSLLWPLPRKLQEVTLELVVVGITAILALSAVWSINPDLTLMRATSFGLMLFGVVRLVNRFGPAWDPGALADAIAALAVVVAAGSLLLWLLRPDTAVFVGELRGVLENQNGLGLFLGLTYPFVLAVMDRRIGRRIWLVGVTAPFALLIGLTESRSGALALVAGLTAYELASRFPRRLLLHLLVGIGGFMAVSLSVASLEQAPANPTRVAPGGTTRPAERPDVLGRGGPAGQGQLAALLGARNEGWNAAADLIVDRPLLGYGFGSGDRVFARYPERAKFLYFQGANPNSGYLQALLELGLVLSLVILLPLVYALAANIRTAFRHRFTVERAAFLACLVAGLVAGIFESLFTAAGAPWAMLIWLSAVALLPEWGSRRAGARVSAAARIPTLVESWVAEPEAVSASASADIRSSVHEQPTPKPDPGPTSVPALPPQRHGAGHWAFFSVLALVVGALGAFAIYTFGWRSTDVHAPAGTTNVQTERAKAAAFAQQVAAKRCLTAACSVAELEPVAGEVWRLRLASRSQSSCFLMDTGRFVVSAQTNLQGLAEVPCASVPLRVRDVLTVASPVVPDQGDLAPDPRILLRADVVAEVARRLKIPQVQWRETPVESLSLARQRYDVAITSASIATSLDRKLEASRPFFADEVGIFLAKGEGVATAAELATSRIAAGDGLGLLMAQMRFPRATRSDFPVPEAALRAVEQGRADVAFVSLPSALGIAPAFPRLVLAGRLGSDRDVFVAERDGPLLAAIDRALDAMTADGTLIEIQERWFPGSTKVPPLP